MSELDLFLSPEPVVPDRSTILARPNTIQIFVHRSMSHYDEKPLKIVSWVKAIDAALAGNFPWTKPGGMVSIRSDGDPFVGLPGKARTVPLRPVEDPLADSAGPWRWTA